MQILRVEKKNEETGELSVEMLLTKEQTQVLIEYALNSLVQMGLIQFVAEEVSKAASIAAAEDQETFAIPAGQTVN